jgi:hypothetical protein
MGVPGGACGNAPYHKPCLLTTSTNVVRGVLPQHDANMRMVAARCIGIDGACQYADSAGRVGGLVSCKIARCGHGMDIAQPLICQKRTATLL